MKIPKPNSKHLITSAIVALIVSAFEPALVNTVLAATPQFRDGLVRLNRLHKSSVTGGTVCVATPASAYTDEGNEVWVDVGFPTQTTVASVNFTLAAVGSWTLTTTSDPDGVGSGNLYWPNFGATTSGAWPGVLTGTVANRAESVDGTNRIVRVKSSALAHDNQYCFNFNAALTLPDTAGFDEVTPGYIATYKGGTAGTPGSGTEILRTNWATQIVDDNAGSPLLSEDQIVVNAIVPPLFQFDLSSTTDFIPATGNLNYQVVNTSGGVTATVHTNAKNGWVIWSRSANNVNGLVSASAGGVGAGANIPSVPWNAGAPTNLDSNGTAPNYPTSSLYGMTVATSANPGNCTVGIAPEYDTAALDGTPAYSLFAGAMTANFQQIADCSGGTSNGDAVTIKERASITVDTPAATDYTDTLTVVGAGNF
jgi:hypothetical protein